MILASPGSIRGGKSEKFEFADPFNEHANFLNIPRTPEEPQMVPQGIEMMRNSIEKTKREQRREESTLKSAKSARSS